MTRRAEAATYLSQVPIFARLDDEILDALADQSVDREFSAGDQVAVQGAPNDGLLVIVEGELEAYRGSRVFKVLGPGDYVGDMSLLDGEPHMVDVIATKGGHGIFLDGHQFQAAVRHHPQVATEVIKVLVARIRETVDWLEEAEQQSHAQPNRSEP
jgi:CRP-like cAMP-binding protein